jgi:hypothetical protein
MLAFVFLAVVVMFAFLSSCRRMRQPMAPAKLKAPPSPLVLGGTGLIERAPYHIQSHTLVEIAQVGQVYERHEYHLSSDDGANGLLVYGWKPGDKEWLLFTPFQPQPSLTPQQAAAKRAGDKVDLDGSAATVTEIFLTTIRQIEIQELAELTNGAMFYGFQARSGRNLFLTRWNESGISCYRGRPLPAQDVIRAFIPKPAQ